jgi:hypothetical protein
MAKACDTTVYTPTVGAEAKAESGKRRLSSRDFGRQSKRTVIWDPIEEVEGGGRLRGD